MHVWIESNDLFWIEFGTLLERLYMHTLENGSCDKTEGKIRDVEKKNFLNFENVAAGIAIIPFKKVDGEEEQEENVPTDC